MIARTGTSSVTVPVQQVERATKPLPTSKTHLAISKLVGRPAEACCDYSADCIERVTFHPLLAAAHFCFSPHRPLVLSPDMIWTTIVQGFARHIINHAEQLRNRFVTHQGKLDICIERTDLHRGSPENPWNEVIHDLSTAIREHLGPRYDELVADFSTTGPVERTACEVALLDAFKPFFEYRVYCVCGIPEVTLEGTPDDWQRLRSKAEALAPYELDWWLPNVRKICDQFVRASEGDVDTSHWRNLYKQEKAYGSDVVNGWLVELVPYLKHGYSGNFTVRNPLLKDPASRVSTTVLPSGVSQVPFRCRWRGESEDAAMELLGGFVGVTQHESTLALRPKLGWAVRQASELDQLFSRLLPHAPRPPLDAQEFDRCVKALCTDRSSELPGDFLSFYKFCNGVNLFGDAIRFRPLEEVAPVQGIKSRVPQDRPNSRSTWNLGPWVRFCDLSDGSFVAIELGHTYEKGWKIVRVRQQDEEPSPIVSWSVWDFLRQALHDGGRLELDDAKS